MCQTWQRINPEPFAASASFAGEQAEQQMIPMWMELWKKSGLSKKS